MYPRSILSKRASEVAPQLLGALIKSQNNDGLIEAIITEVEAYESSDPASHTFGGKSLRNASMFKQAGTAYVYLSYGLHWCLNVVCGQESEGQGVLIRSVKIVNGQELAWKRRFPNIPFQTSGIYFKNLSNGPGKVGQALGISKKLDGTNLLDPAGPLSLHKIELQEELKILNTTRIGITKNADALWRWHINTL